MPGTGPASRLPVDGNIVCFWMKHVQFLPYLWTRDRHHLRHTVYQNHSILWFVWILCPSWMQYISVAVDTSSRDPDILWFGTPVKLFHWVKKKYDPGDMSTKYKYRWCFVSKLCHLLLRLTSRDCSKQFGWQICWLGHQWTSTPVGHQCVKLQELAEEVSIEGEINQRSWVSSVGQWAEYIYLFALKSTWNFGRSLFLFCFLFFLSFFRNIELHQGICLGLFGSAAQFQTSQWHTETDRWQTGSSGNFGGENTKRPQVLLVSFCTQATLEE